MCDNCIDIFDQVPEQRGQVEAEVAVVVDRESAMYRLWRLIERHIWEIALPKQQRIEKELELTRKKKHA